MDDPPFARMTRFVPKLPAKNSAPWRALCFISERHKRKDTQHIHAYRRKEKLEMGEQVLAVYSTYCSTVRAGVPVQRARIPSFPDTIFFVASQGPSVVTVTRDLMHSSGVPPLSPEAILKTAPRTKFLATLDGMD